MGNGIVHNVLIDQRMMLIEEDCCQKIIVALDLQNTVRWIYIFYLIFFFFHIWRRGEHCTVYFYFVLHLTFKRYSVVNSLVAFLNSWPTVCAGVPWDKSNIKGRFNPLFAHITFLNILKIFSSFSFSSSLSQYFL